MTMTDILSSIDAEIARLQEARNLLAGSVANTRAIKKSATKKKTGKRVMSAEARKRIGDAQRKRWAGQKVKK